MALSFAAPAFPSAKVSQDLSVPIVATKAFNIGDVVFAERALVSSTFGLMDEEDHEDDCDNEDCAGCREVDEDEKEELDDNDIATITPAAAALFDELNQYCDTTDVLGMVDVRKNMLKLFALYEKDNSSLQRIFAFKTSAKEAAEYLEAAVGLRAAVPGAIPAGLDNDKVAHIIGVLNKYCIPLDDIRGSGLFMYVAKLTHSCTPNCNFTDAGENIWVTAIKPIAVGETLTVDLYDLTYQPQAERTKTLEEDEATCSCGICTGTLPDKCRAFKCKNKACDGIAHPIKSAISCMKCKLAFTSEQVMEVETLEVTLPEELEASSLKELDTEIAKSPLHKYHYIYHAALTAMVEEAVEDEDLTESDAIEIYKRILECLEYVIDVPHGEKVSVYNSIAQMNISMGNIPAATEAYTKAYKIATECYGAEYEETQMFKQLMEHTPKTPEEMMAVYGYELVEEKATNYFQLTMVLTIYAPTFTNANVSQDIASPVVATTNFKPGQVLFYEASLVSSSSRVDFQLDKINIDQAAVEQFDAIIQFCASNELLNMMDLSKNLLKLFHLINNDSNIIEQLQVLRIQDDAVYHGIAQELLESFPSIVPAMLTVENIAHLIGVLHVHSHELDDIHGTGLFPAIARLQHKCIPNCNITTNGDIIWVTAIAPIAFGEPLSLDMFDLYYTTAQERLDLLTLESIQCSCEWCTGVLPDLSRAFKCFQEGCGGIVHPRNDEFICQSCSSELSESDIDRLLKAEEDLSEALQGLTCVAELLKLVNDSPIHQYHKLFYSAVNSLNTKLMEQEVEGYKEITQLHRLAISAASHAVPYAHYRKIQHYDELAQTLISIGDIIGAKDAYAQAYEMSCICSGSQSQQASFLRTLADTTPVNRQELLAAYEQIHILDELN